MTGDYYIPVEEIRGNFNTDAEAQAYWSALWKRHGLSDGRCKILNPDGSVVIGRKMNLEPPRPEREWPVALLIIGAGIAILATVIGIALEAGK